MKDFFITASIKRWNAWRKLSGALCDKKMNARLKGKVYKTAVRPAMIYGSETWGIKKAQEKKMTVVEMRMLHWMCGVTKKDKIRNELIRGAVISLKMQERRLKRYGHVMRRDGNYVGRRVMEMEVPGHRRRGWPKHRWKDKLKVDMLEKNLFLQNIKIKNLLHCIMHHIQRERTLSHLVPTVYGANNLAYTSQSE